MKSYDYCIIGGGPAGIGVLDRLLHKGQKNVMLFEGRDELLYTLSFMPFIKQTSAMFRSAVSGTGFKTHLLETKRPESVISLGSRLIGTDFENHRIIINDNGRENLTVSYRNLIIATGGVQAVYGRRLLPGFRGAGTFSTYQTAEMLTRYDFIPGEKLAIIGESSYAEETRRIAQEKGIETILFSNSSFESAVPYAEVTGLEGDEHISGIRIRTPENKNQYFAIDSLATDGEFIMEHKMRELLGIEWDIDRWQAETDTTQRHPDFTDVYIAGDAWKPNFNFLNQYENGYNLAGRIL